MKEQIKEYLLNNEETLQDIVAEITCYDGSLYDLRYELNDKEFFEMFDDKMEIARAICYGNYNFTDEYVQINAYGNLESISEYGYNELLKNNIDEIVETLIEKKEHLDVYDDELKKLLEL